MHVVAAKPLRTFARHALAHLPKKRHFVALSRRS
jgi:hypothetical protein